MSLLEEYRNYTHLILKLANRGLPRFDFLREVTKIFLEFSVCEMVEIRTEGHNEWYICEGVKYPQISFNMDIRDQMVAITDDQLNDFDTFTILISKQRFSTDTGNVTPNGSVWVNDTSHPMRFHLVEHVKDRFITVTLPDKFKSMAFIPFSIDDKESGILIMKCRESHAFNLSDIEFYESIAAILGLAVADRRTQVALRERVKELTCLYGIARLIEDPERSLDEIMQGIVELIPPGWMYPEITSGKIVLDDRIYTTQLFQEGSQRLSAPVIVDGRARGKVEVIYAEKKRTIDEGPFLKEERNLIDAIAREVAHILEVKRSEDEKTRLQEQLRHADRLATIGQLAAGVAHELNEPLGNILGFAQLAQKTPDVSEQIGSDLSKIVNATLHAREIIRKLMVFSRQTPSRWAHVDLNKIVSEGLYFFEARCNKAGIDLVRELYADLPTITADPAQMNQVLVNLVVNSIQAMPQGGRLIVRTFADASSVYLVVEDNGLGMDEDLKEQIFIPFFTTKDIDEGTGLGLPVVHGIITSHRGTISVESDIGKGTKFIIQIPLEEEKHGKIE